MEAVQDLDLQIEVSGSASFGYMDPQPGQIFWRGVKDYKNGRGEIDFTFDMDLDDLLVRPGHDSDPLFRIRMPSPNAGIYSQPVGPDSYYRAVSGESNNGFVCFVDKGVEIDPEWTFGEIVNMTNSGGSAFVELYSTDIRAAVETRLGRLRHKDRVSKSTLKELSGSASQYGDMKVSGKNYRFHYSEPESKVYVQRKLRPEDDWQLIDVY